jgi:hypothetical protein
MLLAMVAEQSEYGGIAVGPAESPDKGRCGGLLKTRKSDSLSRYALSKN